MNNFKWYVASILLILIPKAVFPEDNTKMLSNLAGKTKNWLEGFQKNAGGNTFYYDCFRSDVRNCLITRCTNGEMGIDWETRNLPESFDKQTAGFLWMASIDLTSEYSIFDVTFNGIKRFEIATSTERNWQVRSADGGILSFVAVETDRHGDVSGYMMLEAPAAWLVMGSAQKIGITGRAENSNAWVIVYQATDALAYLHGSADNDLWAELSLVRSGSELHCRLTAPTSLAGKEITCSASGENRNITMNQGNLCAEAEFVLPLSQLSKGFRMKDSNGAIFIAGKLSDEFNKTRLINNYILSNESKRSGDTLRIYAQRKFRPRLVADLVKLSKSPLRNGQILLMNSSHQDIAWMDSPEKC
jgi:alpha-mannosidase